MLTGPFSLKPVEKKGDSLLFELSLTASFLTFLILVLFLFRPTGARISMPPTAVSVFRSAVAVLTEVRLIAHALGGLGPEIHSNCLEAWISAWALGHRVFEADLIANQYGEIYLGHDLQRATASFPNISFSHIKERDAYKCTVIDLHDLAVLLKDHPDMYVVTDLKNGDMRRGPKCKWFWQKFVDIFKEVDEFLLRRVVPMISFTVAFPVVAKAWDWPAIGVDFYTEPQPAEWVQIARENPFQFKVMTMGSQIIPRKQEFIRDIRKAGVLFTPYTINSLEYVQNNTRKYGIDGYYTDFMWPSKWLLAQF